ncbi:MAG: type IX secretion system membrane protein PorP/SprF [Prolixibacteraceae bacterium]|jgi:type IX secretion system PorP/SprF family membrane protein|nr:type IX secretion system membrane protein PorP/SprF [Prolixibacteraceae bacterium]
MKKPALRYSLCVLLLVTIVNAFAQQDPLFTQYMNNPGIINPAYAGSNGAMNLKGIFRKQWLGMDWSPTTTTISFSSPLIKYDVGLGVTFLDDQIGPMHQTGLYADYSRYFRFPKKRNLALGLKVGFNYYDINLTNLRSHEYDPVLELNPQTKAFLPNFGVGLYYFSPKFYAGLSIPKLIRNDIKDTDNTLLILGKEERHYFLTTGALFNIDDPVLRLRTSTMAHIINGSPSSVEAEATAIFYDKVWLGFGYRLGDAITAHLRLQITHKLQIGYSYDLNNSRLKQYNNGSHEIFFSYDFSFSRHRILSPRYF